MKRGDFRSSRSSPAIKHISIQGTAAIITIEPFPENKNEELRLIRQLETSTDCKFSNSN
jgi:hypothetical protein